MEEPKSKEKGSLPEEVGALLPPWPPVLTPPLLPKSNPKESAAAVGFEGAEREGTSTRALPAPRALVEKDDEGAEAVEENAAVEVVGSCT